MPQLTLSGARPLALVFAFLTFIRFVHSLILPKIAARILQQASIRFQSVRISQMSTEDDSMAMYVEAEIDNPSPLPCSISSHKIGGTPENKGCFPAILRLLHWPSALRSASSISLQEHSGRCLYLSTIDSVTGERKHIATLSLPPVIMRPGRSTVQMQVHATVIDRRAFNNFTEQMLHSTQFPLVMDGEIDIQMLRLVKLQGVNMMQKIQMQGMQSLQRAMVERLDVEQGFRDHIQLKVICAIENPSNIEISMGAVEFAMLYCSEENGDRGQVMVGSAYIADMQLASGRNLITAVVRVQPDPDNPISVQAASRMLSNYVSGLPSRLLLNGTDKTTPLRFVSEAMATVAIPLTLQGLPQPLLVSTSLLLFQANPVSMIAPARMLIQNTFDEYIMIFRVSDGKVSFGGRLIGRIDYQLDRPMIIPPKQTKLSDPWPLSVMINLAAVNAMLQVAANQLTVDVTCWLEVKVGQFEARLQYKQKLIPVRIS